MTVWENRLAHMIAGCKHEEFKHTEDLFVEDVVERVKRRHDALKTLILVKKPFQKGSAQTRNCFECRENQISPNWLKAAQ